jgi:hypothetical protein
MARFPLVLMSSFLTLSSRMGHGLKLAVCGRTTLTLEARASSDACCSGPPQKAEHETFGCKAENQ